MISVKVKSTENPEKKQSAGLHYCITLLIHRIVEFNEADMRRENIEELSVTPQPRNLVCTCFFPTKNCINHNISLRLCSFVSLHQFSGTFRSRVRSWTLNCKWDMPSMFVNVELLFLSLQLRPCTRAHTQSTSCTSTWLHLCPWCFWIRLALASARSRSGRIKETASRANSESWEL